MNEYYELLELQPRASIEEIQAARRELLQVWHPDRFEHRPDLARRAEEKSKRINDAADKLIQYVRSGHQPRTEAQGESEPPKTESNIRDAPDPDHSQPIPDGPSTAPGAQENGFAKASLILGIFSALCTGILTAPFAIGFGIAALRRIGKDPVRYGGKSMAIGGIATGCFAALLSSALFIVLLASDRKNAPQQAQAGQAPVNIRRATDQYEKTSERAMLKCGAAQQDEQPFPVGRAVQVDPGGCSPWFTVNPNPQSPTRNPGWRLQAPVEVEIEDAAGYGVYTDVPEKTFRLSMDQVRRVRFRNPGSSPTTVRTSS